MSELTLLLIKLAFLAVLWLFIIMAVGVIRTDLFGPATSKKRGSARGRENGRPRPARSARRRRNEPRSLVVVKGSLAGTSIDLTSQPIIIGRAKDSTLVINDDYASGRHAGFSLRTAVGSSRISVQPTAPTSARPV